MITGGVKTTPALAMQLLCDLQPFTNIIEKNAAILFNRLIRLPNNSFWRVYDSDGGRNLKTQKGFIQCVREDIQYKVINDVPFELLYFANSLDYAILGIRLDLVLNVRKRDLSPTVLHAIALETINTRFPPEEWLHIYTDGSLLDFAQGAAIGVFSHLFSFYLHADPLTTHFDASRVARDKPWSTLCKKSHGIPSSPRAAAVAKFRLLTGHDCLCAHLFRFNLVTSPICVLCDTGQDMTAAHLDECYALNDLNCIVKSEKDRKIGTCAYNVMYLPPRIGRRIAKLRSINSTMSESILEEASTMTQQNSLEIHKNNGGGKHCTIRDIPGIFNHAESNGLKYVSKIVETNATYLTKSYQVPRNSSRLRAGIFTHVVSLSFEHHGFPQFHPKLEGENPGGDQEPPTSLPLLPTTQEDLRLDSYLECPHAANTLYIYKHPCLLRDSNPVPTAPHSASLTSVPVGRHM
ncbi:uncharacterized protein LOC103524116 [Trichonephila clavipes]|nr:uncharacterized protein LOC103524116 [Trichonephila clavipes]